MKRVLRLNEFWSLLPAFRAVAETSHLPTAAKLLAVSPSALSRSVRMLERRLGVDLFRREGRCLVLTTRGERFLAACRDAMRRVDDALSELREEVHLGEMRIAGLHPFMDDVLARATRALAEAHPGLLLTVGRASRRDVPERLLRGQLDMAIAFEPLRVEGLACFHLGRLELAVFAARDHAFHSRPTLSPEDLSAAPFVALLPREEPLGWPATWKRNVQHHVDALAAIGPWLLDSDRLALLPRAASAGVAGCSPLELELPPLEVFSWRRTPLATTGTREAFLEERLARALAGEASRRSGTSE